MLATSSVPQSTEISTVENELVTLHPVSAIFTALNFLVVCKLSLRKVVFSLQQILAHIYC